MIMKKSFFQYTTLFIISVFTCLSAFAQRDSTELRKEVEVVKAYEPIINDAYKINEIPVINQETTEKPTFDYEINSQPVFSTFTVEPVEAAQMTREPKAELGGGLLKGGVGNYKTPYGELFYNTETGRNSTLGLHFKHLSSNGKIKLLNDDKVDAPFSENAAEINTNHYFRRSTLSTSIHFDRQAFRYYGYSGDSLSNETKQSIIPYWNKQQAFSTGKISLQLASINTTYDRFTYNTSLNYQLFGSKTGQLEHLASLEGVFNNEFDSFWGRLDASLTYLYTDSILNSVSGTYGTKQQIILKLNPSILFQGDEASLRVGINSYSVMDDDYDGEYLFTPNVKAEWWPVENTLSLFAGADGYLQHNHYSAIIAENKYVNPFQDIKNAKYNYILNGGIKGKFSPNFSYRFQVDYADITDQHFFILNEYGYMENADFSYVNKSNTFDVLYDDLNQLTIGGELHYAASDEIDFLLKGNYYSYSMNQLEEPWQKPNFETLASINFNPNAPVKFNVDIYVIGERKALVQTFNNLSESIIPQILFNEVYTMDPIIDMNFGIEYQYSPYLSFWGHVNNFSFKKYENWLGYTNQSLNLMAGLSLSF